MQPWRIERIEEIFMQRVYLFVLLLFILVLPISAIAGENEGEERGWAIVVKAGTHGIGADISRSIIPSVLNLRAGASFYSLSKDNVVDDGIQYNTKLKMGAIPIAADVFPFKNWFRLGGGLVVNLTGADGTAQPQNGFLHIGDSVYPASAVGELKAKLKFNRVAPYFGMGFNNPIKKSGHLGFFVDLGFLYHGTPSIDLTASRMFPALQADLDKQIRDVNEDIEDYSIFPVIQLGLSYKF
jgi:hypothetical protein